MLQRFLPREPAAELGRSATAGALADVNRAIEIDPKQPNFYALRGTIHEAMGELGHALSDFIKRRLLVPGDPSAERAVARLQDMYETGRFDMAPTSTRPRATCAS